MIEITNYKFDFYYGKEAEQFSFLIAKGNSYCLSLFYNRCLSIHRL